MARFRGQDVLFSPKIVIVESVNQNQHAAYFGITSGGLVYLKPEYRGQITNSNANSYPYAKGDTQNSAGWVGSKNNELPEILYIPEKVGNEIVTGFVTACFFKNKIPVEIFLPDTLITINNRAFAQATNLKALHHTENVTKIEQQSLYGTKCEKLLFPNLTTLEAKAFSLNPYLMYIDIGNNISSIPNNSFESCERLNIVKGGASVTEIEAYAFMGCVSLRSVDIVLGNVTSIGNYAFWNCRLNYNWNSITATCGTYATAKQYNPTDIWTGRTFTAHESSLRNIMFNQTDPTISTKKILGTNKEYRYGCIVCSLIPAYFVKNNISVSQSDTTLDIINAFENHVATNHSSALGIFDNNVETCISNQFFEKLGFTFTAYPTIPSGQQTRPSALNSTELQAIYNALSNGKYVLFSTAIGENLNGHIILAYGIAENGEILISDSSSQKASFNDYSGFVATISDKYFHSQFKDIVVDSSSIVIILE